VSRAVVPRGPTGYHRGMAPARRPSARFRPLFGMRVWLALVLALLIAATAAAVAAFFIDRFNAAFAERAGEIAVGYSVEAAARIRAAEGEEDLVRVVRSVERERPLSLFVFDADGELLTPPRSRGIHVRFIPGHEEALRAALDGERFVETATNGGGTLVGLRVPRGPATAVVAYASHPELEAGLGLARSKITEAALWGVLVGGLAGVLVAALIARRLARIADSAAAIEQGHFERAVESRFPDEVGALAASVDRMRVRLRESFAELAAERDRLTRLLERLHEGVVAVSADGAVEFANDAARRMFAPAELREGAPFPERWPGVRLRELATGLFREDARVAHTRVERGERALSVVGLPADGADTVVLVLADLSEQERRERAEREFVSNAAHELRTPLQTILGAVEALHAGAKDDPADLERFLDHIEREGKRLARLTRALLVLARAQTRKEEVVVGPVELRPLLEEVASGAHPLEGVSIHVSCPPDVVALADRDLAEQALANLVANAVRHTTEGTITLAARREGAAVEVEVTDTGPGLPLGVEERVFDRFYRGGARSAEGFGLGLAIARESVRAIGGDVQVERAPTGGTIARVVLRAGRREAAA
jgi:signal transduction histidine kinase